MLRASRAPRTGARTERHDANPCHAALFSSWRARGRRGIVLGAQGADTPGMLLEAAIQKEARRRRPDRPISPISRACSPVFPTSGPWWPQALLRLGRCYERLGRRRGRVRRSSGSLRDYPDHEGRGTRRASRAGEPGLRLRRRLETRSGSRRCAKCWTRPTPPFPAPAANRRVVIFSDLAVYDSQRPGKVRRLSTAHGRRHTRAVAGRPTRRLFELERRPKERLPHSATVTRRRRYARRPSCGSSARMGMGPTTAAPQRSRTSPGCARSPGRRTASRSSRSSSGATAHARSRWSSVADGASARPEVAAVAVAPGNGLLARRRVHRLQVATPRNSRQQEFYIMPVDAGGIGRSSAGIR